MATKEKTKITFTQQSIKQLVSPKSGRIYIHDTKITSLAICISKTGGKVFYLSGWIHGKSQRIRIGKFPDLTIVQARQAAQKLIGNIAMGTDPQEDKRRARQETTIAELFHHFLNTHAKIYKKSWREDAMRYNRHLKPWATRKLSSIVRADVKSLHRKIGGQKPYEANRVLSLVSALFNHADTELDFAGRNPAQGIKKFKEQSRDRFLQADEFPGFWAALENDETPPKYRDFFKICLLTGARSGNVMSMQWDQINCEIGCWRIPDTKTGEPQTVYLTVTAIQILQNRREEAAADNPWVFPGKIAGTHIIFPWRRWQKVCALAGIEGLRIHDLRRTLGSWAAASGASLPVIGKALGHKNVTTTQIYSRLNLDPVRIAVDNATQAMLAAVDVDQTTKLRLLTPDKRIGEEESP